ncbi:GNAT family N-acetyltransferase [Bacillus clarus]|uniref:Acetyltransferase family protein n=1 Tax=Bacillus clarus TaxID=2338372 RepID=A0A090YN76_9BACI|nr:GNAT family N-acetyltransferase [Bacillus clarus]KFM99681.1 acetyltransferase family protein [Bacillus clarus]RFT62428.1 GNAT family N-acetyltransferase [Bacillus clarus]
MNYRKLLLNNFTYKTSYVAKHAAKMIVKETKDYVKVDCGLPTDTFNIITLLNNDVMEEKQELCAEIEYFNQKKFPMSVWFWETNQDDTLVSELKQLGLKEAEKNVAMVVDLKTIDPIIDVPAGFTIQKAASSLHIQKFGDTLSSLFGTSAEGTSVQAYYNQISSLELWDHKDVSLYLGIFEDEVVSIGSLICTTDSIGIYDIATKEKMRERGFGSAMFNFLLNEAKKQKELYCVLQASPDGINIYKKSGFQPVGRMIVFENRHLLEA